jgi:3-methylfumaryl-CoA hydratase
LDIEHLKRWVGRSETRSDEITAAPMTALAATLDLDERLPEAGDLLPRHFPQAGDLLPPLWHWLYFLPFHRQSELGPDGHARRGGFLPPVDLPRRMWAGGRIDFIRPLRAGESVTRTSHIAEVRFKEGRSGPLVFVLVRHEIRNELGLALTEEHDIVYRNHASPGEPAATPQRAPLEAALSGAAWGRTIYPDDVLLFRYSALTFNGHRIHYDRRYATEIEGYPGLVVHGPLIATLLADLVGRNMPGSVLSHFEFRALSPIFDTSEFRIEGTPERDGKTIRLWAKGPGDVLAMSAIATVV